MQKPNCMLLWVIFVIAYNLFVEMLSWVLNRFLSINIQKISLLGFKVVEWNLSMEL